MKAEYINLFIEAAQSVFKMLCGIKSELGEIRTTDSHFLVNQVAIMIGVFGKVRGQVCFELTIDTAKKIASVMMGGMPITELDEMCKSAVSEMGNMIMGNTSTMFSDSNINIDITPPTLLAGEKIEISNKVPTTIIPLKLEGLGTISINVAAEEVA